MATFEVVSGRLLKIVDEQPDADTSYEDTGVNVQVFDDGMRTVFRCKGKGVASYSGVWHETAVLRFIITHLGVRPASLTIYRSGQYALNQTMLDQ